MSKSAERRARAERLHDYFDLQLRFTQRVAEAGNIPLTDAVGRYTNFHRRFGLGPVPAEPCSIEWARYVQQLMLRKTHEQKIAWTQAFFLRSPEERLPPDQRQFGCFGCFPPDRDGMVRFHFANRDSHGGTGPLGRSKIATRKRELRDMFTYIRTTFPRARVVQGISWLYHLDAYRRLFPVEYGRSRAPPTGFIRLNGSSSWGQFLDHRENIKPDLRDAFLQNFQRLDPEHPWRIFPLLALRTRGPIDAFYKFYGVEGRC